MRGQRHSPGRTLPPGKTRYLLYRRLGGPQGRSGHVRKISPPQVFDPRTVQPVGSRYTDYRTILRIVTLLYVTNVISTLHFVTMFTKTLTWLFSAQQTSATPNRVQQKPCETIFLPATVPEFKCLSSGSQRSGLFTRFHGQSRQLASRFYSCHVVTVMCSVIFVISRRFRLEGHVARKEDRWEGR